MIHPSYVELMRVVNEETALVGEEPVVNSRYSIVSATAKRARQIVDGDDPYIRIKSNMKPLSIAVEELYEGELKILTPDEVKEKEIELAEFKEQQRLEAIERAKREEEEALRYRERERERARMNAEAEAAQEAEDEEATEASAREDGEEPLDAEASADEAPQEDADVEEDTPAEDADEEA